MNSKMRRTKGFTIVELLIVIVVIGILAALVMNVFAGAQEKARAAAVADGLKNVEKAFTLYAIEQGRTTWWGESELGGQANPSMTTILNNSDLDRYLPESPKIQGLDPTKYYWFYDNDQDASNNVCNNNSTTGVNILINGFDEQQDIALEVDKQLDDGNLACGKVRQVQSYLRYVISFSQSVN